MLGIFSPADSQNSSLHGVLPHATYTQGEVVLGIFSPADSQNSSLLGVLPHATYTQVKVVLRGIWSRRESRILLSSEFCLTPPTLR